MLHTLTTALIVVYLLASAASYLFSSGTIEGVRALGFPDHFRIQLAVMKIAAALVLAIPMFPPLAKEWATAGTAFFIITAIVAHAAHRDPIWLNGLNLAIGAVLAVSWATRP